MTFAELYAMPIAPTVALAIELGHLVRSRPGVNRRGLSQGIYSQKRPLLAQALEALEASGMAYRRAVPTRGRTAEVWYPNPAYSHVDVELGLRVWAIGERHRAYDQWLKTFTRSQAGSAYRPPQGPEAESMGVKVDARGYHFWINRFEPMARELTWSTGYRSELEALAHLWGHLNGEAISVSVSHHPLRKAVA